MHRKLAALAAIILAGAAGLTGTAAAEASLSGWTNACFGSPCTAPTAASLQIAQHEGLLYVNATYAGSTADGTLALGGSPSMPNVDNLGSFILLVSPASYEGVVFDLRVRVGDVVVAVPGVLHGAVTAEGTGGVVVDFDNDARSVTMNDGTTVALAVQDVAVVTGGTIALGGTITTSGAAAPTGGPVAQPDAGVAPLAITGLIGDAPFAGTTAGGVLPLVLGTVTAPAAPAVHDGETVSVTVQLTAPVTTTLSFTGAVRGTVVAAGTGAYVVDFPSQPVTIELADGNLVVNVNDLAVGPGHTAELTGQVVQPPFNRPPVGSPDTLSRRMGNHAVGGNVLVNDTDPDGDALTAELLRAPLYGNVSLMSDGSFTYTPRPPNQGADTFTYRAFDGRAWSEPVTVTVTPAKQGRP